MIFDHLYADDARVKRHLDRQRAWYDEFQRRISNTQVLANIKNEDEQYVIELAAPGFDKSDFSIELDNGVLAISADTTKAKNEEKEETVQQNYKHREFAFQAFKRTFNLPEEHIDLDGIKAEYQAGILSIVLPKKEVEDTKRNFDVQ